MVPSRVSTISTVDTPEPKESVSWRSARCATRIASNVTLFLEVDLQTAYADAGLGQEQAAFERIDGLLARDDSHPLTLSLLHEARARFAAQFHRK